MYVSTTAPNESAPNADKNRFRPKSEIPVTSTLNCSANSTTTGSDEGSPSNGSGGSRITEPQVCRTRALTCPSDPPGDSATKRENEEITPGRYCA
jgi:hypothetical protein